MKTEEKQALHEAFLAWAQKTGQTARSLADTLGIAPQYTWALLKSKNLFSTSLLGKLLLEDAPVALKISSAFMKLTERTKHDTVSGSSRQQPQQE